jgi:hypothetical protein
MDENAFLQKLSVAIVQPCTFEKSVLTHCVACERAGRVQIAEREAVNCQDATSLSRCTELHGYLRHSFSFALGQMHDDTVLTHAQEMRVQCGGLKGLQYVLDEDAEVDNVDALMESAVQKWGGLEEIPYSEVVHAAALCYKGRHG